MFNCSLIILIIIIASMISADKSSNLGKCQQEDLLLADCLEPHQITPKLQDCLNTVPISFRNLRKFQSYTLDQKKLVNCVIEKMKDDQVCKNRKIIDSVEKSLNATRLIIRNFKRFRKGIMEPMVFSESMLSGIEVKRNKKI